MTQEREAFEAWVLKDLLDAPVHTSATDKQWRAWQARASLAQPASVPAGRSQLTVVDVATLSGLMHDAAIRYSDGYTVDFDAEASDFLVGAAPQPAQAVPMKGTLNLNDPSVQKRLAAQWGYVQAPAPAPEVSAQPEAQPGVPAGSEVDGERAEFEAWAKPRVFSLVVLDDDPEEYKELETASAWESWQARAALASSAQAGGVAVPAGYKLVPEDPTPEMVRECMGRLMDSSLIYERNDGCIAVESIAPARLWEAMLAASPQAPQPAQADRDPSPTAGMTIAQRILHVGGRNNAAGYVEFGSIQAVVALVRQVLRDLPAAPQPEAQPQWQPIETAPKDGAEFLGWDASVGNIVMYWDDLSSDGRWSDGVSRFNRKPTHWMPLPSAPSAQAEPTACPHTGQCHPGFCPCSDAKRQAEQKGSE